MSAFTRMRRGLHLGFHSLRIAFRDKTLLLFPAIPITCAIAIITSFYVIVGPDKVLFFLNTLRNERGVQLLNWGYYENALIAYAILAVVSVFFAFGLVACTRITLFERDSKFLDGLKASLRNIHWVLIWAFIAWTIGPILTLLDHERHTSRWVRRILKTSWSLLNYFVIPIVIVDRINLFSALRQSVRTMSKTWGNGAVSQLGLMWFFWLLNLPTILIVAYGINLEGDWPKPLTFIVLAMVYGTIVIYQTASSVLSVVLYKYALDGTVVEGFNEKWLKEAFVRPKVYVLVDEEVDQAYAPLEEVPAPQSVEPVETPVEPEDAAGEGTPVDAQNNIAASIKDADAGSGSQDNDNLLDETEVEAAEEHDGENDAKA